MYLFSIISGNQLCVPRMQYLIKWQKDLCNQGLSGKSNDDYQYACEKLPGELDVN